MKASDSTMTHYKKIDYTKPDTFRALGQKWPVYRDPCPACGKLGLPRPIANPREFWHRGTWNEETRELEITESCKIHAATGSQE